jgi:hypothetical protein
MSLLLTLVYLGGVFSPAASEVTYLKRVTWPVHLGVALFDWVRRTGAFDA